MKSDAYMDMVRSAQKRPEFWRLFVILAVGLVVGLFATPLFFLTIGAADPALNAINVDASGMPRVGVTPGGLFVVLAGFAILVVATVITAERLTARSLRDITGPSALMRRDFWATLKWLSGLLVVLLILPSGGDPAQVSVQYGFSQWLFWVPFAVIGLMVQVLAEELFFRGYFQTQITGATKSYVFGVVGSAALFGVGHVSPVADGLAGYFPVLWAICFGVVAGDLTMRSGTIGPAVAIHLVNNFAAMMFAPHKDVFSGFGMWVSTANLEDLYSDPMIMIYEFAFLAVTWLAARVAIRR
ncbi:CPBP family intramembrane glutamic endopeptidase [Celeribacter sp.]|uniref:CPBP family intramembrane glutamic endopeptidase n=1 Tax=Celeribacter sp. TaxID=1890673 RepID=UPI003A90EA11